MGPVIVIVMGVSGAGKTTIGAMLAARIGAEFIDADDIHPPSNIEKMRRGIPLDDSDRYPWLEVLAERIVQAHSEQHSLVLACSALKQIYRDLLSGGASNVHFIHLTASRDLIGTRLQSRSGHFMPASLIDDQFAALEPPNDALSLQASDATGRIVETIIKWLAIAESEHKLS